jgi:lysophospholipid acyltransferase (LPLAT)-like uncharacterized protein
VSLRDVMVPAVIAVVVRALGVTLRLRLDGIDRVAPLWREKRPLVYAVWHGRILMAPWANAWLRRTHGARPVAVLASRSRDGELVSCFVRRFGLAVVRGSSSRGGPAALRRLVAAVAGGNDVAVVPDGPRGPRGQVQPGVVALAAFSGAPIVPLAVGARPSRCLRTWDEFLVPLPFARCAIVFGEPITVDRAGDLDRARKDVEVALDAVTTQADRLVES